MGVNRYRIEYDCDCGENYGGCDKHNVFILESYRSCDVYKLYHKNHKESVNSKFECLLTFTDNGYSALTKILGNTVEQTSLPEDELKEIKEL